MPLGDYVETEYVAGVTGISAVKLNNNEVKTKELDTELNTHANLNVHKYARSFLLMGG